MACIGFLDYRHKIRCPVFDVENCPTPLTPPLCPLKENLFKRPCLRYKCNTTAIPSVQVVHEGDFQVIFFCLINAVGIQIPYTFFKVVQK